jgi:ubiquinone/menaquinone biosynthesis C-methylase UbiE
LNSSGQIKQCCCIAYSGEAAKYLLGDSFHPGGLELTAELASLLGLNPKSTVLDVAAGKGTTALFLGETYGCKVVGIDLSEQNVHEARTSAAARGLAQRVEFQIADGEALPFAASRFDAIVCECAFCTFPDKKAAAREFARVLRPGGCVGITDITRDSVTLPELDGLFAWIACIGDAQPLSCYEELLVEAGLQIQTAAERNQCLEEMVRTIRGKLLTAELLIGLKKLQPLGIDLEQAKSFSKAAQKAVTNRHLGYGMIVASKTQSDFNS